MTLRPALSQRLYAADLGLFRLRAALAATSTTLAAVMASGAISSAADKDLGFVIPSVMLTAVATMLPGLDPDPRRRLGTWLLSPVPAVAGLLLGVVVSGRLLLTAVTFIGLVTVTLACALTGPRGIGLGLTAIAVFYGTNLVGVPSADIGLQVAALLAAGLVSALMLGFAFKEGPERTARRVLASLHALSRRLSVALQSRDAALVRSTEERLAAAVGRSRTLIAAHTESWPVELRTGAGVDLSSMMTRLHRALVDLSSSSWDSAAAVVATEEARISHWHGMALRSGKTAQPSSPAGTSSAELADLPAAQGERPQVAMAVQLLVAATVSVAAAMAIDQTRWFWGVLAALVMLFGTSSAADAIGKGARRAIGTAAALPIGIWVGSALQDHLMWIVVAMLAAVFLQQYLAEMAYASSVFFLTLFLSLVFALAGDGASQALWIRLVETTVGAVIGTAVALFVMPARTGAVLRGRALDVIDAATVTLNRVAAGRAPDEVLLASYEAARRFDTLRSDADASRQGWPVSPAHSVIARQVLAAGLVLQELEALASTYADTGLDNSAHSTISEALRDLATLRHEIAVVSAAQVRSAEPEPEPSEMPNQGPAPVSEEADRLRAAIVHLRRELKPLHEL